MLVTVEQAAYILMAPFLKMDVTKGDRRGGAGGTRRFIAQREINPRGVERSSGGQLQLCYTVLRRVRGSFMATIKNDILPTNFTTLVYRGLTHPLNPSI